MANLTSSICTLSVVGHVDRHEKDPHLPPQNEYCRPVSPFWRILSKKDQAAVRCKHETGIPAINLTLIGIGQIFNKAHHIVAEIANSATQAQQTLYFDGLINPAIKSRSLRSGSINLPRFLS